MEEEHYLNQNYQRPQFGKPNIHIEVDEEDKFVDDGVAASNEKDKHGDFSFSVDDLQERNTAPVFIVHKQSASASRNHNHIYPQVSKKKYAILSKGERIAQSDDMSAAANNLHLAMKQQRELQALDELNEILSSSPQKIEA